MEFISGPMEVSSKEIGKKTKSPGMAFTIGKMEAFTRATGNKIICMDKVCTNGLTADNMKVNTLTTRKRAMEFTNIPMAAVIKDNGNTANNTERVLS